LPFKSNRGGRCFAASKTVTSHDLRLHPSPEKRTKGKGKRRTSDKSGLLKKNSLLEIVMNIPVDFYLFPCYTIYIDRKKLIPLIFMISLLVVFSFAILFVFSLLIVGTNDWVENHHPKTKR
jgi:hypothetical protein